MRVDRESPEDALQSFDPDIVIDASGPFQAYGRAPYRLVEACLAAGAHYLDLADAATFMLGVDRFDEAAKAKGLVVLSGLSTAPALSGAVLRRLTDGLDRIDSAWVGIAPSPFAGLGLNVVRAIAGQAGRPVTTADGRALGVALVGRRQAMIAPPGVRPLKARTFSLVQATPSGVPGLPDVWTGAGTVPELLHRGLNLLAGLVRRGVLPSLEPLSPLLHWAVNSLRWGEHRGGMLVEVEGVQDGVAVRRSWHLIAESDAGHGGRIGDRLIGGRRRIAGRRTLRGGGTGAGGLRALVQAPGDYHRLARGARLNQQDLRAFEHRLEHRRRQAARVRVQPGAVIAVDQPVRTHIRL